MNALDNIPYSGTPETVLQIFDVAYGEFGAKSRELRSYVEEVVKYVRPRDYWSEALAIYYQMCGPQFRYTHDPTKVELVKSPVKMVWEIQQRGLTLGDCDDLAGFGLGALSVIGIPARLGTGAFEIDPELWPKLELERPERFGFVRRGEGWAGGPFSHVWVEGYRPDGTWVMLDPVAGPDSRQMRRRVRQIRYYIKP